MKIIIYPDYIRAELDDSEFLEIANEFIEQNYEDFKKFCKGERLIET